MPLSDADKSDILITGGTGLLGVALVSEFQHHNIPVSISSRSNPESRPNWHFMDLEKGTGIEEAIAGKRIILHLASGTRRHSRENDVLGTLRILDYAKKNGVAHFVYISIVGIDKVPLPYYQYKLEAEDAIRQAQVPYTILRATQFYEFVDFMLHRYLKYPIGFIPKQARLQPIETSVVAKQLFDIGLMEPANRIINLGGREVLSVMDIARSWLNIQGKRRVLINAPVRRNIMRALARGGLTCPERSQEGLSWKEWLEKKYTGK